LVFDGNAGVGAIGPSNFGPGTIQFASSGGGDAAGILSQDIYVPANYVSGSQLSDSATWNNTTISALGLTPGTYTWTWGSGPTADSLEVVVVPEPSSFILLGIVAAFGFIACRWRRRRQAVAA
jgi:PEP-CTERM motif